MPRSFNSNALKMNFERTTRTSANAKKHICRSYYQQRLWIEAPFRDATLTYESRELWFWKEGHINNPWNCDYQTWRPTESMHVWQVCSQEWVFLQDSWGQVLLVLQMQGRGLLQKPNYWTIFSLHRYFYFCL